MHESKRVPVAQDIADQQRGLRVLEDFARVLEAASLAAWYSGGGWKCDVAPDLIIRFGLRREDAEDGTRRWAAAIVLHDRHRGNTEITVLVRPDMSDTATISGKVTRRSGQKMTDHDAHALAAFALKADSGFTETIPISDLRPTFLFLVAYARDPDTTPR